jgi:hypothetical protein
VSRSGKARVDGEVREEVELVGLREEEEEDGGGVSGQLGLVLDVQEEADEAAVPFPYLAWRGDDRSDVKLQPEVRPWRVEKKQRGEERRRGRKGARVRRRRCSF